MNEVAAAAAASLKYGHSGSADGGDGESHLLSPCDTTILLLGTMAAPPRTRTTTWQVWVWLPLMKLRVDESQLRDLLATLLSRDRAPGSSSSSAGGGGGLMHRLTGSHRFDKRVWSAEDEKGWWSMMIGLLPALPGSSVKGRAAPPPPPQPRMPEPELEEGHAKEAAAATTPSTQARSRMMSSLSESVAEVMPSTPPGASVVAAAAAAADWLFGPDDDQTNVEVSTMAEAPSPAATNNSREPLPEKKATAAPIVDASDANGGGGGALSDDAILQELADGDAADAASARAAEAALNPTKKPQHTAPMPLLAPSAAIAAAVSSSVPTIHQPAYPVAADPSHARASPSASMITDSSSGALGSGVCLHVSLEIKKDAGEAPLQLAAQASKLSMLTKSIRTAPEEASHYYARACALLSMKMYSEAAHDADACLKLQPRYAKARFTKGRALYFLGEYEQAFAQYDAGLRIERHPKVEAWLTAERRKPEYHAVQPGVGAALEKLGEAIRGGDIKRLALVLGRCPAEALDGELVVKRGKSTHTAPPLHLAAWAGQVDCCVLLLQRDAPAEGRDSRGRTPLMLALERGHVECACALLPHCADLDLTDHEGTPALHRAAARGLTTPLAMMLATPCIDIFCVDAHKRTAAHVAALAAQPMALMQILNAAGTAAASSFLDVADADGCTPALAAARAAYLSPKTRQAHLHCVTMCVLMGADCSVVAVEAANAAAAALTPKEATTMPPAAAAEGAAANSPIAAVAAADGAPTAGATPSPPPPPLYYRFIILPLGETDLLQLLGASPSRCPLFPVQSADDEEMRRRTGRSMRSHDGCVLHWAAAHGQLECMRLLLTHGAAPDEPDAYGRLPADHALRGAPGCPPGEGHAECHLLLMRQMAR